MSQSDLLGPIKVKFPGLNAPLTAPDDEPITVMEKTKEEIDAVEERLKNIIATRPSLVAYSAFWTFRNIFCTLKEWTEIF